MSSSLSSWLIYVDVIAYQVHQCHLQIETYGQPEARDMLIAMELDAYKKTLPACLREISLTASYRSDAKPERLFPIDPRTTRPPFRAVC